MSRQRNPIDRSERRRCACPAEQELRWESPLRRLLSCGDCGIWWEELKPVQVEEGAPSDGSGAEGPLSSTRDKL